MRTVEVALSKCIGVLKEPLLNDRRVTATAVWSGRYLHDFPGYTLCRDICYEWTMIQSVLFDLDNTLYPSTAAMERDIIGRMNEFTAGYIGISIDEARNLRRSQMAAYGTTLEWLMAEHGFEDPEGYFAFVHPEGEEDVLEFDPALGPFLVSVALPKYVFTNAPMAHAERVLRKLGIERHFISVFDIRFNNLRGKPHEEAIDRVLAAVKDDCGALPGQCLFVDDVPRYVRGFVACGGAGLLIDHDGRHGETGLPTIRSLPELRAHLS